MGAAAYNRGSKAICDQIAAEARPAEFVLMDDLNALPKFDDAGTPFGEVRFVAGHGGFWAECPVTGFGYWYRTLREAVRRWCVEVYAYEHGAFIARPLSRTLEAATCSQPGAHVPEHDNGNAHLLSSGEAAK